MNVYGKCDVVDMVLVLAGTRICMEVYGNFDVVDILFAPGWVTDLYGSLWEF